MFSRTSVEPLGAFQFVVDLDEPCNCINHWKCMGLNWLASRPTQRPPWIAARTARWYKPPPDADLEPPR
jgi:hypothetical protein